MGAAATAVVEVCACASEDMQNTVLVLLRAHTFITARIAASSCQVPFCVSITSSPRAVHAAVVVILVLVTEIAVVGGAVVFHRAISKLEAKAGDRAAVPGSNIVHQERVGEGDETAFHHDAAAVL